MPLALRRSAQLAPSRQGTNKARASKRKRGDGRQIQTPSDSSDTVGVKRTRYRQPRNKRKKAVESLESEESGSADLGDQLADTSESEARSAGEITAEPVMVDELEEYREEPSAAEEKDELDDSREEPSAAEEEDELDDPANDFLKKHRSVSPLLLSARDISRSKTSTARNARNAQLMRYWRKLSASPRSPGKRGKGETLIVMRKKARKTVFFPERSSPNIYKDGLSARLVQSHRTG